MIRFNRPAALDIIITLIHLWATLGWCKVNNNRMCYIVIILTEMTCRGQERGKQGHFGNLCVCEQTTSVIILIVILNNSTLF